MLLCPATKRVTVLLQYSCACLLAANKVFYATAVASSARPSDSLLAGVDIDLTQLMGLELAGNTALRAHPPGI